MSDTAQGPDWWLASDGKWYPPQSRPGTTPDPAWAPPPTTPLVGVSSALTTWVQVGAWALAATLLVSASLLARTLNAFDDLVDSGGASRLLAWLDADDAASSGQNAAVLVGVVWIVLVMVWMHRAHRATDALQPQSRSWTAGWTVGGWFIPLAQLVIPKLVLGEIERIAASARSGGRVAPNWRQTGAAGLGWLWWVLGVVGMLLAVTGLSLTDPSEELPRTVEDVRLGYQLSTAGSVLGAAGMVAASFHLRSVGRRLTADRLGATDTPSGA